MTDKCNLGTNIHELILRNLYHKRIRMDQNLVGKLFEIINNTLVAAVGFAGGRIGFWRRQVVVVKTMQTV